MQRKLPRFFLLSFLSFAFFSVIFQAIAYAQGLNTQYPVQSPLAAKQQQPLVPTPTIYIPPASPSPIIHEAAAIPSPTPTNLPSPTPTLYIAPPQPTSPPATPVPQVSTQVTSTPTQIPVVSPTVTSTPTTTVQLVSMTQPSPSELESFFSQFSSQYNVSEDELKKIAQCESGFNTNSDTGTYAGMYQFLASTWESERSTMGLDPNPDLRKDAQEAIHTAAFMLSRGGEDSWPNCH